MPELSPASARIVQAFDDRYELIGGFDDNWQELCIAAALRAAIHATAKQRVIQGSPVSEPGFCPVDELLAIVAELEAS